MSAKFVAEQYNASRIMLRISADDEYSQHNDMHFVASLIAKEVERLFVVDGSTIMNGIGRWKGESESAKIIEVIVRGETVDRNRMTALSQFINMNTGLTCFATVEPTTAFELYELSE